MVDERTPMSATRRALFAVGFAVPVLAAAPAVGAKEPDLMAAWREHHALESYLNANAIDMGPEIEAICARLNTLENLVFASPIRSRDDAIAKLLFVSLSVEKGERSDHADEVAAADCHRWMAAH